MCEYCGCQSVTAIGELTREQDIVVNLIGDVRAAHATGDVPRMAELARRIAAVLGPHTEVEEHGLFPSCWPTSSPTTWPSLEAEHRRIETVLGVASMQTPTDPGWPRQLMETLDLLREHILKEQDGVFPAALTALSGADWDSVDAVRTRAGSLLLADPAVGDRR